MVSSSGTLFGMMFNGGALVGSGVVVVVVEEEREVGVLVDSQWLLLLFPPLAPSL